MKRLFYTVFFILSLAVIGIGGYFLSILLEGTAPTLRLIVTSRFIGERTMIKVVASDEKAGLRRLSLTIMQGQKKIKLKDRSFPVTEWWKGSSIKEAVVSWEIRPRAIGLKDGKCKVVIEARDASLRSELKGNLARLTQEFTIDTTPPRIFVLSLLHNIRIGGSGLVTFKVNEPCKRTGVEVNGHFFKAFPRNNGVYSCLFAIPVLSRQRNTSIFIVAIDQAGNEAKDGFPYDILPYSKKRDNILITDTFLRRKMPGFARMVGASPDDLFKVFLLVNGRLRKENNQRLLAICSKVTGPPMWKGAFKALPHGARRAGFADDRHYFYKGRKIDQAYHMGIDLASIRNAPVPAANNGKVVYTGDLGIYGNTVVIDHGGGLYSEYSHLSDILVTPGEDVEKGKIIGRTDTTGLAGGDHLHFAVIVQGVFVNPLEWLDSRWIRDHIEKNMFIR